MTTELISAEQVQFLGSVSSQISQLQKLQRDAIRDGNLLAFAVARIKTRHWLEEKITAPLLALFEDCAGTDGFFKTTRQESKPVLKNCLIEAFLNGLNPVGEEFMIIQGKLYIHQAGYRRMLKRIGVRVRIMPGQVERVRQDRALASLTVQYQIGDQKWEVIEYKGDNRISVKLDKGQADDAVLGKSERKAMRLLYSELSDIDTFDLDEPDDAFVDDSPSGFIQEDHGELLFDATETTSQPVGPYVD